MTKIMFEKSRYQGKEAFFIETRIGDLSSKEILLVDSGADYLTVSGALAEQLDLDLQQEINPELALEYHDLDDNQFDRFFREKWLNADRKGIKTFTDSASAKAISSVLHPVEVSFGSGVHLDLPVNFVLDDVGIPMLGRRGLYSYCERMVIETGKGEGFFELKNKFS